MTRRVFAISFALLLACVTLPVSRARAEKPAATTRPAYSSAKYEKDIEAFEAADRKSPPAEGGVVFVGDSGIRMWKTLASDFPDQKPINRGFGGSHMIDSVYYADRIVIPYKPRHVVIRAGSNDLTAGKTPEQILADFQAFVKKVRAKLPETRITLMLLAPSPARWSQAQTRLRANAMFKEYIATQKNMDYVEIWDAFLGPDGKPREDLFIADHLHCNAAGYKIMADAVRPHLN